jgi:hypothetical protein
MRIYGKNFEVVLQTKNGTVVAADRAVRYMKNWPIERVVRLARRWHWEIILSDEEKAQLSEGEPTAA